ncbi:hypothetical protein K7432_005099, partial [Basidiobolus ranarum]
MSETDFTKAISLTTCSSLHKEFSKENKNDQDRYILEGQIVHSRKLSKKLFFFDLRVTEENSVYECCKKIECITRYDEVSLAEVDILWRSFKLGDKVRIFGQFEQLEKVPTMEHSQYLFHAKRIEVTLRWNPEVPFVPERPVREVTSKKRLTQEEEQPAPIEKGVCKYWINTGNCQVLNCPYQHPTSPEELSRIRKEWVTERVQTRRKLNISEEDPHSNEQKQSHRLRAKHFVDWLIKKYSIEYLNSGEGVLDVAGGRGDISFELHTKRGIKATLIEPREMKLSKPQRKFLKQTSTFQGNVQGTLCKQVRS